MSESLSGTHGRVVVVAADRSWSADRCGYLTSTGWRTAQATTVEEALALVRNGDVEAVILHIRPPFTDNHAGRQVDSVVTGMPDLPDSLRLASKTPHLPVIVLARNPNEQTRCLFLNRGADDVVCDDISPAELDARLRAMMRSKVLHDELQRSKQALSDSLSRERALLRQLRRDNAHLLTLSTTDPLTHLQNIRHFDSFLENEFKITRRYNRRLSLLAFDLDHFKVINDMFGHPTGDYVLKEFAVILERAVRDSDVVARTGGEEFSIILPDAGRRQARHFAQRIRRAVSERKFIVFGQTIHVTTSIGSASYPEDAEITGPDMLVYLADQALLRAKQIGRDRLVAFSDLDGPTRRQISFQFQASIPKSDTSQIDPVLAADARR